MMSKQQTLIAVNLNGVTVRATCDEQPCTICDYHCCLLMYVLCANHVKYMTYRSNGEHLPQ